MRKEWKAPLLAALATVAAVSAQSQPSKQDSGWVPLWNGKDWEGLYYYVGGSGVADVKAQANFTAKDGQIHANGPYALLTTLKEYSYYKVRVEYQWPEGTGASANAGLMVLMDNQAAQTSKARRPRSIEVNMRRDNNFPWSLWAGENFGPYITTTVEKGSQRFLPPEKGGVPWTCEPWDPDVRVVHARADLPKPELGPGLWNTGEAHLYGDSGEFYLNGVLRTRGWKFQARGAASDPDPLKRVKVSSGGVALQSEGSKIAYRNWEIMELDPATLKPIHATRGCTDAKSPRFNPRAVVEDGSCGGVAVKRGPGKRAPWASPVRRLRTVDGRRVRVPLEAHKR